MSRKKNNKIRQLSSSKKKSERYIELEDDSSNLFEQALEQTDWKAIGKEKESFEQEEKPKTKSKKNLVKTLDLHGYTTEEAKNLINDFIYETIDSPIEELTLKIITGKGRRSENGEAVLAKEIPDYLEFKWKKRILYLEESPANLNLEGSLLRGHFSLKLNTQ